MISINKLDKNEYNCIGVMSGTSLDGVDIAFCKFYFENNKWQYSIEQAETIKYDKSWKNILAYLENSNALNFVIIHKQYGHFLGKLISKFIRKHRVTPDFIASHGHTIFHQPENKITFQIGDGAAIAAECGFPVVCDFRSLDVAMGGQGAPLVPIGDKLLFADYDYCLNLGGFANISFENKNKRIAFDICPVNIVLNKIAENFGKEYDENGAISAKGKINLSLLNELNDLGYYKNNFPKSLGKEWVLKYFFPILNKYNIPDEDKLCTVCEHIALQISHQLASTSLSNHSTSLSNHSTNISISKCNNQNRHANNNKMLITGGGAYNSFLISRINENCKVLTDIPSKKIIDFKEALIFAFLGVLRITNNVNCLSSVTGASSNNIGGAVYFGQKATS